MVVELDMSVRVLAYFRTNDLRVINPWFEADAKGVEHQDRFWIYVSPTARWRHDNDYGCE
jgi:hypothetical protein